MPTFRRTYRRKSNMKREGRIIETADKLRKFRRFEELGLMDVVNLGNLKAMLNDVEVVRKERPTWGDKARRGKVEVARKIFATNLKLMEKALKNPEKVEDEKLRAHLMADSEKIRKKFGLR